MEGTVMIVEVVLVEAGTNIHYQFRFIDQIVLDATQT